MLWIYLQKCYVVLKNQMETKCGLGELLQSYAYLEYYTQNWNFFLLIPFKLNF